MVKRSCQVVKLPPRRKTLQCRDWGCDISTNKRYRPPAGFAIVACCYDHAEAAYLRRNGKTTAAA